MAIAFVQSTSGTNAAGATATTPTTAFTNPNTAGNAIIVAIANDGTTGSVTSVTDTAGNSYSLIKRNTAVTTVTTEIWAAFNIKARASNIVTANQGFNDGVIVAQEFSGLAGTTDKTAEGNGVTGTATATTAVTTSDNELVFAAGEVDISGANTLSVGASYSNFVTASSNSVRGAAESNIVSASGAQTATMGVAIAGATWRIVIATFPASSNGATIGNFRPGATWARRFRNNKRVVFLPATPVPVAVGAVATSSTLLLMGIG